jgi:branched-chain amino acid transport system permease protein
MGFMIYPTYRIVVLAIAALALAALYVVLYRTRIGIIVRAGIEDSDMVGMLGINVYRVFMLVFGIGAMAAGFAGIINAPVVSLTPDMGESILVQCFVVVVIGGVGSFPGAILGGLIAGEILSLTSMVDPAYSGVMLFAVMTLVLLLRPQGLLGVQSRE